MAFLVVRRSKRVARLAAFILYTRYVPRYAHLTHHLPVLPEDESDRLEQSDDKDTIPDPWHCVAYRGVFSHLLGRILLGELLQALRIPQTTGTIRHMAKGKKPADLASIPGDQRRVVVRPRAWRGLLRMCDEKEKDPTELANQAIQEFLERVGYWDLKNEATDTEKTGHEKDTE